MVWVLAPAARADNALNCTVADEAGNPAQKIEVVLTLKSTGKQWKKKTNDKGTVEFKGLEDGSYRFQAAIEGFLLTKGDSIELSGNTTKTCQPTFVSVNRLNQLLTDANEASRTLNVDLAIEKGKSAVELAPSIPNTYIVLAIAYARKGMVEDAVASAKKAAELDSAQFGNMVIAVHMEALGTLASQALAKLDFDGAIKRYQEVIALAPNEPTVYYNMALAYGHKGDYDQAIKNIDKAIEVKPDDLEFKQRKLQLQDMYLKAMDQKLLQK